MVRVKKLMELSAKKHGYKSYRKRVFWQEDRDLLRVVDIQIGQIVNIYAGIMPKSLMIGDHPPSNGYWGLRANATQFLPWYSSIYVKIAMKDESLSDEEMADPIDQIFHVLKNCWRNHDDLRADVLDEIGWARMYVDQSTIIDWAEGELGGPEKYFKPGSTRYYG